MIEELILHFYEGWSKDDRKYEDLLVRDAFDIHFKNIPQGSSMFFKEFFNNLEDRMKLLESIEGFNMTVEGLIRQYG